jgi:class 3 adenylate cyclase
MLRVIKQFRTQEDKPVDLRIGINTGDVLTGEFVRSVVGQPRGGGTGGADMLSGIRRYR